MVCISGLHPEVHTCHSWPGVVDVDQTSLPSSLWDLQTPMKHSRNLGVPFHAEFPPWTLEFQRILPASEESTGAHMGCHHTEVPSFHCLWFQLQATKSYPKNGPNEHGSRNLTSIKLLVSRISTARPISPAPQSGSSCEANLSPCEPQQTQSRTVALMVRVWSKIWRSKPCSRPRYPQELVRFSTPGSFPS